MESYHYVGICTYIVVPTTYICTYIHTYNVYTCVFEREDTYVAEGVFKSIGTIGLSNKIIEDLSNRMIQ